MPDFSRRKSLDANFVRVRLDESDLARLARTIREATNEYQGEVEIRVTTADGAETFESSDPKFLESTDMPRELRSVSLSYREYKAPLACRLELSTSEHGRTTVSVDGQDVHRVTGLFDDLKRQMEARRVLGWRLFWVLDTWWFGMLLSILVAVAIYSVFDLGLNTAYVWSPQFKGSALSNVIGGVGWTLVGLGFVSGQHPLLRLIRQSFPAVEFAGRLSDQNRVRRSLIYWAFSAIFVPIVVRAVSSLIVDLASHAR